MNTLTVIAIGAGSLVLFIISMLFAIKAFYKVPKADEALIKTGGKKPVVTTGGGVWIVPMFHEIARVSLQAIRVPIDRMGNDAVPSRDMIPAGIKGEMYVQINPQDDKAIVLAVQSLGTCHPSNMGEIVREKIDAQVTDALRTAAFQKTFLELNSEKKEFADAIMTLMQDDLAKLGLTLTAVAVTHVSQEAFTADAGDVIAAEGRRNVARTVEKNRQETNLIENDARIEVQKQDVNAKEQALALALRQKMKEADQAREVAEYEATQSTETEKAVLVQSQAAAEARVAQERGIAQATALEAEKTQKANIAQIEQVAVRQAAADAAQKEASEAAAIRVTKAEADRKVAEEEAAQREEEAKISKARAVETALIAKNKDVEAAKIAKEQAIKVADEQRQQAVQTAAVAREQALALVRADEAAARATQAEAEAKQKTAEEAVTTATETAAADRAKQIVVIKAEEKAKQAEIDADQTAYVEQKTAEGQRDAAIKKAEAVAATAKGEADAVRVRAEAYAADKTTRATADADAAENEANALTKLAEARLAQGKADAESERLMVEARNQVAKELLFRDVAIQLIAAAPAMLHEVMAPVANVAHDVKILQVNGLGGGDGGEGGQSIPGTIIGAGLAASGALPVIKDMVTSLVGNDDVKAIAGQLGSVVTHALGSVAKGVRATPDAPSAEG